MIHKSFIPVFFCLLVAGWLFTACNKQNAADYNSDMQAAEIASMLLNNNIEEKKRRDLIDEYPCLASEILTELIRDLESETREETKRIPWIFRVTVAAGERNTDSELLEILEISLPKPGEKLLNWQTVVLGGGIVNGISRQGIWPKSRIHDILQADHILSERWKYAIEKSYQIAANPEVPNPWRYDALRILAMDSPEKSIPELQSYLDPDLDDHLHMGAISGLSDIQSPEVTGLLLSGLPHFSDRNRNLVLKAMLRTDLRIAVLFKKISSNELTIEHFGIEQPEPVSFTVEN